MTYAPHSKQHNEQYWDERTVAACLRCHCGYISVNPANPRPVCLACGGPIRHINEIVPVTRARATPPKDAG